MANTRVETIMREAIKNAESGSSFITLAPVLGARLETIQFAATKGKKVLCGINIETSLAVTALAWGGGDTNAVAAKQFYIIDDLRVQVDNQLRMDSTDSLALLEWIHSVIDRVQSDTILTANGTARSYAFVPLSGAGGRDILVDIDFATFASMYTGGTPTEGAKTIVITPCYTDMALPVFTIKTGTETVTGTGTKKMQVTGDFIGNGYLDEIIIVGDGTLVVDDFMVTQSSGLSLYKAKAPACRANWQNIRQVTIATYLIAAVYIDATKPFDINDKIELDITTAGTWRYALIFKNTPTVTASDAIGSVSTPTIPETTQPPASYAQTSGRLDPREVIPTGYGGKGTLQGIGNKITMALRRR